MLRRFTYLIKIQKWLLQTSIYKNRVGVPTRFFCKFFVLIFQKLCYNGSREKGNQEGMVTSIDKKRGSVIFVIATGNSNKYR